MSSPLADIKTKMAAAAAAISSGDYADAKLHAMAAQALMAGLPNAKSGDEEFDFSRRSGEITALLREINRAQHASGGFRRIPPF